MSSDTFQQAMLLRIRCDIEARVSEREGMIAANQARIARGDPPQYDEQAFLQNAQSMTYCAPDPHNFS